jgi:hypothetical protein
MRFGAQSHRRAPPKRSHPISSLSRGPAKKLIPGGREVKSRAWPWKPVALSQGMQPSDYGKQGKTEVLVYLILAANTVSQLWLWKTSVKQVRPANWRAFIGVLAGIRRCKMSQFWDWADFISGPIAQRIPGVAPR